jgi:hypothetical protein
MLALAIGHLLTPAPLGNDFTGGPSIAFWLDGNNRHQRP